MTMSYEKCMDCPMVMDYPNEKKNGIILLCRITAEEFLITKCIKDI